MRCKQKPAEQSYIQGDEFFEDEHIKWEMLNQKLLSQDTLLMVETLRKHYKENTFKPVLKGSFHESEYW